MAWLRQADATRTGYTPPYQYLAHFLGSAGFGWFYGGSVADALCAGVCGLVGCAVNRLVSRLQINKFFSIVITGFFIALTAYVFYFLGLAPNTDATIIGPLMTLVPGLLFTNAMRDIIFGDTNSGIIRVVQVLLIAVSIAVGTGTALHLCTAAFGAPAAVASLTHSVPVMLLSCAIGCVGFAIYFNIHGPGMLICVLGGVLTWGVYAAVNAVGGSDYFAYFLASAFASLFAEVMARLRKYPAISYLVVSTFPLLPGGGIYYTMSYAVQGNMVLFSQKGMQTISIAGAMAVGILMITTFFRLLSTYRAKKPKKIKNF